MAWELVHSEKEPSTVGGVDVRWQRISVGDSHDWEWEGRGDAERMAVANARDCLENIMVDYNAMVVCERKSKTTKVWQQSSS
mmetsp:Transcript_24393/g.50105  ORF Transcript_24393/g.50105 Transcript_24393/m.50105 type:complete len:82 (-) Transcript_24393:137-382(-)